MRLVYFLYEPSERVPEAQVQPAHSVAGVQVHMFVFRLADGACGAVFAVLAGGYARGPADMISTVEFDATGDYLATGDKGGRVVVFERSNEKVSVCSWSDSSCLCCGLVWF